MLSSPVAVLILEDRTPVDWLSGLPTKIVSLEGLRATVVGKILAIPRAIQSTGHNPKDWQRT